MYAHIKQLFAWKGLKQAVQDFVRQCVICQQAKSDRSRLPGLLQPLQVPTSLWQIISMDFIVALPKSQTYTCILVVVDVFTKYANFLPLKHPFTTLLVARLFHDQIYKHHGLPQSIISDRDSVFLSHLWQELFRLADVKLCMSSAYHPQSDGQTERVNQCVETFRVVLFMRAQSSGVSGYLLLSFGLTPPHIQLLVFHLTKLCMGAGHMSLASQRRTIFSPLIWRRGCMRGN
jgi:transposase InsO family protein